MRRRRLLKGMAAGILAAEMSRLPLPLQVGSAVRRRVRPSDAGWPGPARWKSLNEAVGGNLMQPRGLFAACEADPGGAGCAEVGKSLRNPFYISDQPAGTEVSGWLDAWTPAPSAYAVRARNTADVAAAVDFARENNLRLVVKGTGHSYLGTSNAPDSLLVWTRAMNQVELHEAFVPQGCQGHVAPAPAVSAGAGAMWIDLYDAVTTRSGRYVQGGGCTSVGVAGLVQSGGFGSFSKGFGTAAASLLEAEVVLADGSVVLANARTHPDLLWALKGGGGGSWGVVTRLTLRTHALPEFFGFVGGRIVATSDAAFQKLIERVIALYRETLFNPHWGEQIRIAPDNSLELSLVCQGLDGDSVNRIWQPFFDSVRGAADLKAADLVAGAREARHWWDVVARKKRGSTAMISDERGGAPAHHAWWSGDQDQVGAWLHGYESIWLPATLLEQRQQPRLAGALFAASRHKKVELHFNKGIAGAPAEAVAATRDTATNPSAAEAFVLAIIADGEGPAYPGMARAAIDMAAARTDARQIDLAAAELRKVAPDAGSYVSESNFFNPSWHRAYWGSNYERLRAIKKRYDPDGLFIVHHGVGSEAWSADGFTRL